MAGSDVEIVSNVEQASAWASATHRRHVPFAMAVALTRTVELSRDAVRTRARKVYEIRSPWILNGISIRRAEKRDLANMNAAVGSRDEFMTWQETGGEKPPREGKRARAVPTLVARGGSKAGKLPRRSLPKGGRRPFFLQKLRTGASAGKFAVLRRATRERYPLQVIFLLRKRVRVRPELGMEPITRRIVRTRLRGLFFAELNRAAQPKDWKGPTAPYLRT